MGDEHECCAGFFPHSEQRIDNLTAGCAIEISSWLIRQYDSRLAAERARDCDPLLFAARQFGRKMIAARGQSDIFKQSRGYLEGLALTRQF